MDKDNTPAALRLSDQLGPLVEAAGMVNYLNHGAASHVSSEGCNGVSQEHLERFAELLVAAERERCLRWVRGMSECENPMTARDCADMIASGREYGEY